MRVLADQVRSGHRIAGVVVHWVRPVPDYTEVAIGLDPAAERVPGAAADNTLWVRTGTFLDVEAARTDDGRPHVGDRGTTAVADATSGPQADFPCEPVQAPVDERDPSPSDATDRDWQGLRPGGTWGVLPGLQRSGLRLPRLSGPGRRVH